MWTGMSLVPDVILEASDEVHVVEMKTTRRQQERREGSTFDESGYGLHVLQDAASCLGPGAKT